MADTNSSTESRSNAIAIIGMACRLPGARNVTEYWENLRTGVESIKPLSDEVLRAAGVPAEHLADPSYVKSAAILDGVEDFDAGFFGFSPKEASIMDPQHRHFLECGWEAFEDAGYDPLTHPGSIASFAGCGMQAYFTQNLAPNRKLMESTGFFLVRHTGNDKDFLATRLAYQFNLRGPSISIQTACSTSLVAVHAAVQSLLSGECDMAIAGGVTIELPHRQGYLYQEGEILSHDGHCRSFDADSTGTVFGSGVGAVVLKRFDEAVADGDTIHAVLIGSAVNNDGAGKVSYLAPSVDGQSAAVSEALAVAGVDASTITYVETHGTGTQIGDPIEVTALTRAFRESSSANGYCALGAVKTNLGHLDTAAGVAGLIKTVLALKHRQLPPTLHFRKPNPQIQFPTTPFFVNAELRAWTLPAGVPVRRAGVNSLGVGGTNAHVVLEEAPPAPAGPPARDAYLLTWSGRSQGVLDAMGSRLAEHLRRNPELNLADVENTLRLGRRTFPFRRTVAVRDLADAIAVLEAKDPKRIFSARAGDNAPPLVFLFPGGGVQYPNMGLHLSQREPVYRQCVDECLGLLQRRWQIELRPLLYPAAGREAAAAEELERPLNSILSIFITEYAQAQLWLALGLKPAMMTGHSLGEYTAACLSGVISLEDTLAIVVARGRIFERLPAGAMLSVRLNEADLQPHLSAGLCLAAVNGPDLCVVSGTVGDIEALAARLESLDIENQRLRINVAAHSQMLEPFLDEFRAAFKDIRFHAPKIPFVSNLTGQPADGAEVGTGEYWVRHLRRTVRFSAGLRALQAAQPNGILVEIGPGNALSSLAGLHDIVSIPSMRHAKEAGSDYLYLYSALGRVWAAGYPMDWSVLQKEPGGRRIPLPTYPFEHQRYWIEARTDHSAPATSEATELVRRPLVKDWLSRLTWTEAPGTELDPADRPGRFILFGGPDDLAAEFAAALAARFEGTADRPAVVRVVTGSKFEKLGPSRFQITFDTEADLERVLSEAWGADSRSLAVVHLSHLSPQAGSRNGAQPDAAEPQTADSFFSVVALARALGGVTEAKAVKLAVVTADAFSVAGECPVDPEAHLAIGALRVMAREFPAIRFQVVDLARHALAGTRRAPTLGALIAEFGRAPESREVALRAGRRWVPTLAPTAAAAIPGAPSLLKRNGVYLITGGLSGLGLALAGHLAQNYQARLVLVSRSAGSGHSSNGGHDPVRALSALTDTLVVSGDIGDLGSMRGVLKQAEARFGPVDGVFHCAGVIDDGLIVTKTREAMQAVLRPKVAGVRVIEKLFHDRRLDFLALYSSTSSWLGLPGQVDYAAANAYLDAFAARAQGESPWPVRSIGWGAWKDTGMASRLAGRDKGPSPAPSRGTAGHPFLGSRSDANGARRTYTSIWKADDLWVLDGHRNKEGIALFPGTGYLELARAAMEPVAEGSVVTIVELAFISPLVVEGPTEMRIEIESGGDFVVSSRPLEGDTAGAWVEHARGEVSVSSRPGPARIDLAGIKARCTVVTREFAPGDPATRQDTMLRFGKRWANIRRAWFGESIALGEMLLPEAFASDLVSTPLHPAVVDIATAFALPLVKGYAEANWFYVPLTYRQVDIHRPLPARCFSFARCADTSVSDTVVFDVTLADEKGEVCAQISGFAMKRLADPQLKVKQVRDLSRPPEKAASGNPTTMTLADVVAAGIPSADGLRILEALLSPEAPAHVYASPLDPAVWSRLLSAATAATSGGAADPGAAGATTSDTTVSQPRPRIDTPFVKPAAGTEEKLAGVWREALGLAEVGMDDNYFELGGNSLGLVQVIMKCRKALKISIPVGDPKLLANPTIRAMAAFAANAPKGAAAEAPEAGVKRVARDRFKTDRTALSRSG